MHERTRFVTDGSDIRFPAGEHDNLVANLEAVFGPKKDDRILVFVRRVEFNVENEIVPLFLDEDGAAHIELRETSEETGWEAIRRMLASGRFIRSQSTL
jgi:hypothetical protein